VREALRARAALNKVSNSGTSENRLLQMARDDVARRF
jgi:hypothetical protein